MRDAFELSASTVELPAAGRRRPRAAALEIEAAPLPGAAGSPRPVTIPPRHLSWYFSLLLLALLSLLLRAAYLQLWRGQHYAQLAEGNRVRILEIPAQRGLISDRHGRPLAINIPNLQLMFTPVDLPKAAGVRRQLAAELSGLLGSPAEQFLDQFARAPASTYLPVVLQENLSHQQAIRATVLQARWGSLRLQVAANRRYPIDGNASLSHLLGYLGKLDPRELILRAGEGYRLTDTIGKSGVELTLEGHLRGRKGREQIEVDALGRRKELFAAEPPLSGDDVVLTIDAEAQAQLEAALRAELRRRNRHRGAAVALDPLNGEILAVVSLPTFDSNRFAQGISVAELQALSVDPHRPLFNRAIQGTYPSGSTIKPIVAAAALTEGIVTPRTTILSTGGLRLNRWYFPDWKAGGHGRTNLTMAIAESVNTYFYYLAGGYEDFTGLGVERLTRYLRLVGLGQPLGVELPGEAAGLVPDPAWKLQATGNPWYIGDTYHLGIGQGDLLVTPLQVASFTAVVANGGTLLQPHLVRRLQDPHGTGRAFGRAVVRAGLFPPDHLAAVRTGLRQAVVSGSARSLGDLPIAVAGKTGTAQWSLERDHHAWFTGFAPADYPELVLTVLIEEGGEGSESAVPVARHFFRWWAEHRR